MSYIQSSSMKSDFSLTFEYEIATIIIIFMCTILIKSNTNIIIVIIAGLILSLILIYVLNFLLPRLNSVLFSIYQYLTLRGMTNFYSTGYVSVWPPILIVFVVFLILVYNSPDTLKRTYEVKINHV
jgi:hypothetical protein